ncbi:MAG: amidohydrolase [Acetobacteraceae bacterium]|nr:amidohydrolase [Acetobacteraceae bacterium]
MTNPLDAIGRFAPELDTIRRDLHAHPELGLEEHRTAEIVARKLEEWGIEVHRGVGRTGVVGVLRSGNGPGSVGLRADMDALPITEENEFPYRSRTHGIMHACGHDGHTAILLGAARYLAETRNFNGTVHFIFQPGEEGVGGALAMLDDGLFERFPCDAVYALHNYVDLPLGQFAIRKGAQSAAGAFFDIEIEGRGAHGAYPHEGVDPVLVAAQMITALQSVVSRNVKPSDTAVVSVTRISAGNAYNVIPRSARLAGTARAFQRETMALIEQRMRQVVEQVAAALGARATLDFRVLFAPLVNDPDEATAFADAAADLVGEANVDRDFPPSMGSEDFSFMLEKVRGAYIVLGQGDRGGPAHSPTYDYNDAATPLGAAAFARLVERKLAREGTG